MTASQLEVVETLNYYSGKIVEICKHADGYFQIRDYKSNVWWVSGKGGYTFTTLMSARRRANRTIDQAA